MTDSRNDPAFVGEQRSSFLPSTSKDIDIQEVVRPPVQEVVRPPDGSGRRMADRLREKGFHPVIVLGTTASGKSTLLSSLIGYLKTEPSASISIGEWIVPPDSPYGEYHLKEYQLFFHHSVQNFLNGIGHAKTMLNYPVFIPVVVRPGNGLPDVKFAFLESPGEWYLPKPETAAFFQPLKQEILDVLFHFPGRLSVLHVAPFTTVDGYGNNLTDFDNSQGRSDSDLGLLGAIKSYENVRATPHKDSHLFLFTKWDLYAKPHAAGEKFSQPDPEELSALLYERFNQSWTAFQSMAIGDTKGRRSYMQYCAGLISGNEVRRMEDEIRPILQRYPRTVWNWLYTNATTKDGQPGQALFRDVLPVPPRKPTLLDHAMRLLGTKN